MTLLRFDGVGKTYPGGHRALDDLSFSVQAGEMVFVTGHSGAGKSTLLKLAHLSERPSAGSVWFDGKNLDLWESTGTAGENKGKKIPAAWKVENGYFEVVKGTGDIQTVEKFKDFQLHFEWSAPNPPKGESQGRGNSGLVRKKPPPWLMLSDSGPFLKRIYSSPALSLPHHGRSSSLSVGAFMRQV